MNRILTNWLHYLETLHPKTIDLGLERVTQVARQLNLLSLNSFVITVAGTNGKGSTVALLENIFLSAGYSVASYTSPHLLKFNERIKLNGVLATDAELCCVFDVIENGRGKIPLTYFEFTTLAALYLFSCRDVACKVSAQQSEYCNTALDKKTKFFDVIILEVGLGGRLDAVNIVEPDMSIITNIALDHCEWLGDTREKIAFEKAGIMRTHNPVIFAERDIPQTIIQQAQTKSAALYYLGRDFNYEVDDSQYYWQFSLLQKTLKLPKPQLHPDNVAGVLAAVNLLPSQFKFTDAAFNEVMATTVLGRWTKREYPVAQYFDVTHNAHASAELANKIKQLTDHQKKYAVFSMLQDKDIHTTLNILAPLIDHWFVAPLNTERSFTLESLQACFNQLNIVNASYFSTIKSAHAAALKIARKQDVLVCFGSFYLVAELLPTSIELQHG